MTLRRCLLWLICWSCLGAQPPVTAIVGGRLIDVLDGRDAGPATVLISGSRIAAVGRAGELRVPPVATMIDAAGKWLLPGLMDMHVHVVNSQELMPLYLAHGVTTVRDAGGDVGLLRLLRAELESGRVAGPRLHYAGAILDGIPPSRPVHRILVDSTKEAASAVNFLADQGAEYIKVYNELTESNLIAILEAARKRDLPVIGHVPRSVTTTRAVELGMYCLEHIRITGRELLPKEEADKIDFLGLARREALLWQRYEVDSVGINKLIALIAKKRVFLDPTLVIDAATANLTTDELAADSDNSILPRRLFSSWTAQGLPDRWKLPDDLREISKAGFQKRLKFVKSCYQAGVRLLAGTDGPGLGPTLPGIGLHRELELLVKAGLPPIDAIRAATRTAAEALRVENDIGAIQPGKLADIVILDADPLRDIRNTRRVFRVIKGGQVYDPQILAKQAK